MKTKALVKLGLSAKSVPVKIEFGRHVVTKMTANANFAAPDPALVVITAVTDDLEVKYNAALDGGKDETADMHASEDRFDLQMTAEASYVNLVAKGDATIILSSGMDVKKTRSPIGIPGIVANLAALIGKVSGSIRLRWKRVRGAALYLLYMSSEGDEPDKYHLFAQSTSTRFIASGLETARKYWFKVEAVGAAGKGPQSDPASSYAF